VSCGRSCSGIAFTVDFSNGSYGHGDKLPGLAVRAVRGGG
jgi:hypothetical protein